MTGAFTANRMMLTLGYLSRRKHGQTLATIFEQGPDSCDEDELFPPEVTRVRMSYPRAGELLVF